MKAEYAAELLISIAREDVGKTEASRNRAPWIKKLWAATDYTEGHDNREPYCAAGMSYVLWTFLSRLCGMGELQNTMGMLYKQADKWRCKSARAFGWRDWAKEKGIQMLDEKSLAAPGDFVVYDFSHIGLVVKPKGKSVIQTIEFNTNEGGSRDGDGCFEKQRATNLVQSYIRILNW